MIDRDHATRELVEELWHDDANGCGARIRIDLADPYFFDHPLDHAPGMLLLIGALQLGKRALATDANTPRYVSALSMTFDRFCELAPEPRVHVGRPAPSADAVTTFSLSQGERSLGIGTFRWAGGSPAPVDRMDPADLDLSRAPRELVHKKLAENVLVSPLVWPDPDVCQCSSIPPPDGHRLRDPAISIGYIVELTRQFITMYCHAAEAVPVGHQFLLNRLDAELTEPFQYDRPVTLRRVRSRDLRERRANVLRVDCATDFLIEDRVVGRVTGRFTVLPRPLYERIRGKDRARPEESVEPRPQQ